MAQSMHTRPHRCTHTRVRHNCSAPPSPFHDHSSGNASPRPPRSGTRMNALTATPTTLGTLHVTIYGTPSTAIRPTASCGPWWTAPGPACTAQSMPSPPAHTQTKPPRVLTPTCTHESTPSPPTPHANFGLGQLFPFIANPFTMLGHMPPPFHFPPFPSQCGHTHAHTHTHKTTTEDDDAATLHHTCILKFFHLLMLGFG